MAQKERNEVTKSAKCSQANSERNARLLKKIPFYLVKSRVEM